MTLAKANVSDRLNALLSSAGLPRLDNDLIFRFEAYLSLLLRWNARINLTAIRGEEGILSRHFVESIACAYAIPPGVRTLLDFGSGAGFPGVPIALCRPEISVTLAESQAKKAAFLQEAVRALELTASVSTQRAETLDARFDCVTMRAVDQMGKAVSAAPRLLATNGSLVLMTTTPELPALQKAAGPGFRWQPGIALRFSSDRIIAIGKHSESQIVPRGTIAMIEP